MDTTITLSLPQEIAIQLAANGEDLSRMALEALAIQEYRASKLSTAQLQRVLGFETRVEVDDFLKKHGVELEYTFADLERDREAHRQLGL